MSAPVTGGRIPRGYERGTCRHCGVPIFWATLVDWMGRVCRHRHPLTPNAPRRPVRIPMNPGPTPHGHWRLVDGGRGRARKIGHQEHVHPDDRWERHDCQ